MARQEFSKPPYTTAGARRVVWLVMAAMAVGLAVLLAQTASAVRVDQKAVRLDGLAGGPLALQPTAPGTAQTGNINVTGTVQGGTGIFASVGASSGQQHTLPALASSTVAVIAGAQTLTGKTLTTPAISGPTISGTAAFTGIVTLPTGAAGIAGTATLVAGTVTISTTAVTASSIIVATIKVAGGTGFLTVPTRTAGTSFVITSTVGTDTHTVDWVLVN